MKNDFCIRLGALALFCAILFGGASVVHADDVYYWVAAQDLTFTGESLPSAEAMRQGGVIGQEYWRWRGAIQPYAVLDGQGEVYINVLGEAVLREYPATIHVAIRAPEGAPPTGRLFMLDPEKHGLKPLAFTVPASARKVHDAREKFLRAQADHYRRLARRGIPGTAWFRHQERTLSADLPAITSPRDDWRDQFPQGQTEFEDTLGLFTGGRAISENLQLDRTLGGGGGTDATVAIDTLPGITVAEINWKPLIAGDAPTKDALAEAIPANQHALFFPSFQAMLDLTDEAKREGTPLLRLIDERSEDARTQSRYEMQLCLWLDDLSRQLGPKLITSVAFTGSDPYLRTGSDVAVLFEAKNPAVLMGLIGARQMLPSPKTKNPIDPERGKVSGTIEGVAYQGVVTPRRAVCSYMAAVGNTVVVSNSLYQLGQIVKTAQGKIPALASLDEYTYFRNQYRRDDPGETAFLVMSDAAIRRLCGPRWRIGASRRIRAAAAMAEIQARHLERIAKGESVESVDVPFIGEIATTTAGVESTTYGNLDFLTPIAELEFDNVTPEEARAYELFRDNYQRRWRGFFDPIAVRFEVAPERLFVDVTVMPLIAGSEYRPFVEVASNAKVAPDAGDRHDGTILHFSMSLDADSEPIRQAGNLFSMQTQTGAGLPDAGVPEPNVFSWLGESIAIYVDDDPIWDEMAQAEDPEEFLEEENNFARLPAALRIAVANPLKMAAFLTTLRAFIDQTVPGMTRWTTHQHNEQAYVKVTGPPMGTSPDAVEPAVFYAATPRALILTLNEDLLKRALDRMAATAKTEGDPEVAAAQPLPWLGENLNLQVDRKGLELYQTAFGDDYRRAMQQRAWGNLPILNEWRRRFPKQRPVAFHELYWGTQLVCPGGGEYVWNEEYRTYESTVYGHPGQPRTGPETPGILQSIESFNGGVTFEHDGLRARAWVDREAIGAKKD